MKTRLKRNMALFFTMLFLMAAAIIGILFFRKTEPKDTTETTETTKDLDTYAVDEDGWPEEDIYEEVIREQENITMKNLLMMCMIPDFPGYACTPVVFAVSPSPILRGNYRLCCIFRDGYVYCMNEYYTEGAGEHIYYTDYNDEMWKHFKDIYCVGRLSSDRVGTLCDWVDGIEPVNANATMYEILYPEIDDDNTNITVFRPDFSTGHLKIAYTFYTQDSLSSMETGIKPHIQAGFQCLKDECSRKILDWVLSSSIKENWNKQIRETGQMVAMGYVPDYKAVQTDTSIVIK